MEQTTLASDAFLANATSNLFHRAKKAESTPQTSSVPVPDIQNGELRKVLEQGAQLIQDYASLKTEVLDRSDRALWQLLSKVFDYVLQINASVQKRNVKSDLLAKIKARDNYAMSSSSETQAVVVRYVFGDLARQTRNNYVVVFDKALALETGVGGLLDLLEKHKGVVNFVEHDFDGNAESAAETKEKRKEERLQQVTLMRRLFAAMSHCGASVPVATSYVVDWRPSFEELAKVKTEEKALPKYQAGNFVFFVALPGSTAGSYNLVQGFSPTKDFEDQMLQQIAARMGASNSELGASVADLETSAGLSVAVKSTEPVAV